MEDVFYYSHVVSLGVSLSLNLVLISCLRDQKGPLQAYCKILYVQCGADIFAACSYFLNQLQFVMIDGIFYIVVTGDLNRFTSFPFLGHNVEVKYIALFLYTFPTGVVLQCAVLNVYYRYCLLCKNEALSTKKIVLLVFGILIYDGSLGLFCVFNTYMSRDSGDKAVIYDVMKNYYHHVYRDHPDQILPYTIFNPNSIYMQMYTAYSVILLLPSFVLIVHLTILTFKQLNAARSGMSEKTYIMQRQINRIMLIQAAVPVTMCCIPISVFLGCVFAKIARANLVGMAELVILMPIMPSLITILFVPSFRKTVANKYFRPRKILSVSSTQNTTRPSQTANNMTQPEDPSLHIL